MPNRGYSSSKLQNVVRTASLEAEFRRRTFRIFSTIYSTFSQPCTHPSTLTQIIHHFSYSGKIPRQICIDKVAASDTTCKSLNRQTERYVNKFWSGIKDLEVWQNVHPTSIQCSLDAKCTSSNVLLGLRKYFCLREAPADFLWDSLGHPQDDAPLMMERQIRGTLSKTAIIRKPGSVLSNYESGYRLVSLPLILKDV